MDKKKDSFTYKFEVTITAKNEMKEDRRDQIANSIMRVVHDRECWYARVHGISVKEISTSY